MGSSDPVDPDRTYAFTQGYAQAVVALGARHKLPVLDLHTALQAEDGWQTVLLSDGLHFTPAGQALVGRLLTARLEEAYPGDLRCEGGGAAVGRAARFAAPAAAPP